MVSLSTNQFRIILRIILAMLFVTALLLNLKYSLTQPIWAPRNEMAHFDYIDRVSNLQLPAPGDYISDNTFQMTLNHFQWKQPPDFDGSKQTMAREGYSYEVHQPPVYYLTMGLVNLLPRWSAMSPPGQIKLLRAIQILVLHIGFVLCVPIFVELKKTVGIDSLWGWFLMVFLALVNIVTHSSLGNDSFSSLSGNLAIYLMLLAWNRMNTGFLIMATMSIPTAFLVKYTNGLLYIPFGIFLLLKISGKELHFKQTAGLLALSLTPVILYLAVNDVVFGDALKTGETQEMFASYAGKHRGGWTFVQAIMKDSFAMRPLRIIPFYTLPRYIIALFAMNTLLAVWQISQKNRGKYPLVLLISCLMTISAVLSALALNHFRPGVWWGGFRHFEAISLFWYLSIFGIPLSLTEDRRRIVYIILLMILIGLVARYAYFSIN